MAVFFRMVFLYLQVFRASFYVRVFHTPTAYDYVRLIIGCVPPLHSSRIGAQLQPGLCFCCRVDPPGHI